ncbi:MAG: gliding motility protein GldN, partial [Bacteroidia bacterium]
MQKLKILLLVFVVTIVTVNIYGQEVIKPPKYPDGVYTKENTRTRRAIPYPTLREADVMWSKRVWRVIDLREKMNFPLYYPDARILDRKSLFDVIHDAATKDGTITCFGQPATDDEFRYD